MIANVYVSKHCIGANKLIGTRDSVSCEVLGIASVQYNQRQSTLWIYKRGL